MRSENLGFNSLFIIHECSSCQLADLPDGHPAHTSQQCCQCGHIDKKNRASQAHFTCRNSGVVAHADRNASHTIARKGEAVWTAGRESRVPATP
ncbi:zinc ribbon domain-containing protein [Streptomyces sp. NPDC057696]|uniref:zinc ribbon domain-containing protein n=1 Tax=Streptomyces sp. NPDC057696 TaxID=3346218 RepID=UPI0036814BC6